MIRIIGALLIGIFFLVLYYGVIGYTLGRCETIRNWRELSKKESLLISWILAISVLYFYSLCSQDFRIPNWDSGFYWIKNLNFSELLHTSPLNAIRDIYQSIDLTDYSDVVPAIMAIPFQIFGRHSYAAYRVLLFVMFQIPSYIVITEVVVTFFRKLDIKFKYMYTFVLLGCCLITIVYVPTVFGLFDIADLTVAAAIALLLQNMDYKKFSIKDNILLSILFLLLLFIRRHFSFFALGYFSCYLIVELFQIVRNRNKLQFYSFLKNSFMIGGICGGILVIFFRNYLLRTLGNNYAVEYSARSYGNMADKFYTTFSWVGWIIILFAVIGIIKLLSKKRFDIAFIQLFSTIFILFMYFRIQNLSMQHYYNFVIQLFILVSIGLGAVLEWSKKLRPVMAVAEIGILFVAFAHGMIPSVIIPNQYFLLPSLCYQPEVREDMQEIGELLQDTKDLLAEEEGGYVYCIASSGILNDDILRNYNLPKEINAIPHLHTTCHTDLANGFPEGFLQSDIIITTNPAQTHANLDGQRVVWVLNDLMNDREGILADNFEAVKTYKLGSGETKIDAIVYRKIKELESEDYQYLIDTFNQWYKDYPELFQDRIAQYNQ